MKTKELIAILEKYPDMNVGRYDGLGCFVPLDKSEISMRDVMTSKKDKTYTCLVDDPVWKDKKDEFNEPFEIIIIG